MKPLIYAAFFAIALGLPTTAQALTCTGTEPFWSLTIGKGAIKFDEAGGPKRALKSVAPRTAQNRNADTVRVYQTSDKGRPVTIVIRAAAGRSCSDGMSDTRYPYSAVIIRRQNVIDGCCRK